MPGPIHRAAALLLLGAALSPALGAPAARAAGSCSIDGFSTMSTQWYDARFDGLSSEAHAFFTISISNGEGAPYDVRNSSNGVYIGALATNPTSVMYAVGGADELVQGTNALRFALFCSSGTRIQPITIRYDSVAPDVTTPAAPAFVRGAFETSATASDATSGIEDVRFALAGGSAVGGSAAAAGLHTATLDTAGLLDGPAVLTAIAHDQAGNARTASRTVTIDNGAPSGALAPLAAQHASGVLELAASAADAVSGVERVAFEVRRASAGAWQDAGSDTSAPYAVDLDTAARQDGEYELRVVVRDRAGNETTSAPSPVAFDNTAPSGSIDGLPEAARGVLALSADASDAGSGLASAAFEHRAAGGAGWQSHAGESFALDTRLYADGLYDLRLVLVDRAGNRAVTAAAQLPHRQHAADGLACARSGLERRAAQRRRGRAGRRLGRRPHRGRARRSGARAGRGPLRGRRARRARGRGARHRRGRQRQRRAARDRPHRPAGAGARVGSARRQRGAQPGHRPGRRGRRHRGRDAAPGRCGPPHRAHARRRGTRDGRGDRPGRAAVRRRDRARRGPRRGAARQRARHALAHRRRLHRPGRACRAAHHSRARAAHTRGPGAGSARRPGRDDAGRLVGRAARAARCAACAAATACPSRGRSPGPPAPSRAAW